MTEDIRGDTRGDTRAAMRRRHIGRTALEVTALSLGTAPLGGMYHELTEDEARATFDTAWQSGLRFFDTAPHYGHTKAEHRLGDALRRYPREEFVLSTKVGRRFVPRTTPYDGSEGWAAPMPFQAIYDYTYDGIMRSFEDSQMRLGMVDIVLIHDIGRVTHGEKNPHYWRQLSEEGGYRSLDELKQSRGVKAVGIGVNEGAAVREMMAEYDIDCALLAGRYTLLEQNTLDDLLPECEKRSVSILLGGAFNSGIRARGLDDNAHGDLKFNYGDAPKDIVERVGKLERVCRAHGVALSAAAIQFPYAHKVVATVLMGARTPDERCARTQRHSPRRFLHRYGMICAPKACFMRMRRCRDEHHDEQQHRHRRASTLLFWDPARGDYGWLTPQLESLYRVFEPDDLAPLRQATHINRTVVVQAAPTLEEARYLLDLARSDDSIAAVIGGVPLDSADAHSIIDEFVHDAKFKGVRPMLQDLPDDTWIEHAPREDAIERMIDLDLAFDALIFARHVPSLIKFANRYPKLRIVVDHGSKPPIRDGIENGWQPWADGIAQLAALPQKLFCKLSGLATEANANWNDDPLRPYVTHLIE